MKTLKEIIIVRKKRKNKEGINLFVLVFINDKEKAKEKIKKLKDIISDETVLKNWMKLINENKFDEFLENVLMKHYDLRYKASKLLKQIEEEKKETKIYFIDDFEEFLKNVKEKKI